MESGFSIDPVLAPVNVSEPACPLQIGQRTHTSESVYVSLLFVVEAFQQSTYQYRPMPEGRAHTHKHANTHTDQTMLYIQGILTPSGLWLRHALYCPS